MAGVKTTYPQYDKFKSKWERVRDTIEGQDAMHAAGERYLPKLKDESADDYKSRIKRSNYFNGTWRTISILHGLMFRKDPTLEVPAAIKPHLADVTMSGCSFDRFARNVAGEVLAPGRVGILVDHPAMPENVTAITLDAAERLGLRPTMQIYKCENILNWKHRRIANAHVLSMVVLQELVRVAEDEFSDKEVIRYRVLDLDEGNNYRQRVFEIIDDKDVLVEGPLYPLMNGKPMDFIPFRVVGVDGMDMDFDEPPLVDLVDANIAHYQINADYRHGLHFTGLPTAVVSGYTPSVEGEQLYIGSKSAWVFSDPNAKASYLEFSGQGLQETREALKEIKQEMAMLGARAIADETRQAETLGGTQIKRSGENSLLAAIAIAVSDALQWALTVFAEWAGASGEVEFEINRDFLPALMDAQTLTALVGAVQAGKISDSEFFELMQRGDVIDGKKTYAEHAAEVEIQGGPVRPTPVAPTQESEAA